MITMLQTLMTSAESFPASLIPVRVSILEIWEPGWQSNSLSQEVATMR